ncbi:class III extradiol ring-cleavage dioxygenase family protein [Nocardioides dongkuii]|uniref:hypothetical protein n=1 Tax=Nocardioides dongkuii TaxID=2760089 RepID=UPI001878848C|nr:hypothetical protein [Nocardioides dongkuii]
MRFVLVPGVLALLPEYAGLSDPVAELRAACLEAVSWLGPSVTVLADAQGARVAEHLLGATSRDGDHPSYLVVGNGSARRSEKAPGHLDERSFAFDAGLRAALASGDVTWSGFGLGSELLASLDGIRDLFGLLPAGCPAEVLYDDDPFGVQYWVMRWEVS